MRHRVKPSVPGGAEGPQLLVGQAPLKPPCQALAVELGGCLVQSGVKGLLLLKESGGDEGKASDSLYHFLGGPRWYALCRPRAQAGTGSMSAGPSLAGDETRGETG